ncbi:MAG: hypothetical protein HYU98_02915 [Deltaproteobacteria bacterium]|nr:hypothetical protein [Deltaproteobacteria bacterium]
MFRQLLVRATQLNLQAWQEILRRDLVMVQENPKARNALEIETVKDIVSEAEKALAKAEADAQITDKLKVEVAYIFVTNSLLKPSEKTEILHAIYQLGLAESEEEVLTRLSSGDASFKNSLADFGVTEPTYLLLADKARQMQAARGEFILAEGLSLLTKEKASEAVQKLAEAREFLQRNGIVGPSYLRTIANHATALIAHADGLSKERKAGTGTGQIAASYETAMKEIGELARTHPAGILKATYTDASGSEQRLMRLYAKAATGNRALTPDISAVSAVPILGARDASLFELMHVSEKELATDEGKAWLKRCLMSLGVDGTLLGDNILDKLHTGDFDGRLRIYLTAVDVESIKTTAEEAWLKTAFGGGQRGSRRDDSNRRKAGGHESPFEK